MLVLLGERRDCENEERARTEPSSHCPKPLKSLMYTSASYAEKNQPYINTREVIRSKQ